MPIQHQSSTRNGKTEGKLPPDMTNQKGNTVRILTNKDASPYPAWVLVFLLDNQMERLIRTLRWAY
jgi:hypothetical protein